VECDRLSSQGLEQTYQVLGRSPLRSEASEWLSEVHALSRAPGESV